MKIGDIIEIEGEKYITQREIFDCRYCHFDTHENMNCYNKFKCKSQEKVIFIKIPIELIEKIEQLENQIEMMMNCENCNGHSSLTCSGCNNYSNWHIKQGGIKSENNS